MFVSRINRRSRHWLAGLIMGLLSVALFVIDSYTNIEIATSVLYVGVVLIGATFLSSIRLWAVALSCLLMTGISFFITSHGNVRVGLINTGLSMTAILATALMATRMLNAAEAEHQARLQLLHLSRLSALGEISASIAHEVKQPLAAICSSAKAALNWAEATPPNVERMRAALSRIDMDATRAAEIVDRIRMMSRQSHPAMTAVELESLIDTVQDICRGELTQSGVKLVIDAPHDPLWLTVDSIQIQQVFLNLILNAVEAIRQTDRIGGHIGIGIQRLAGCLVQITLSDDGIGIPEDRAVHIFEPFHTTRSTGLGLGLAICRSIVEAHGGAIHAFPNPEGGAIFVFTLPAMPLGT